MTTKYELDMAFLGYVRARTAGIWSVLNAQVDD